MLLIVVMWCAHGNIPVIIIIIVIIAACHFVKWPWPNHLVLISYTNWLKPSAQAEYTDHKSEFSKIAKVDQIQPDAQKNYNCYQCGYSIWKPTCEFTAERHRLFGHSATTLAIKLTGLESTLNTFCKMFYTTEAFERLQNSQNVFNTLWFCILNSLKSLQNAPKSLFGTI